MAVLHTTTGRHVLTADNPYVVERVKQRYYFTAERVADGSTESLRVSVYDAVTHVYLVAPHVVSEADAATIWQGWYGALSV